MPPKRPALESAPAPPVKKGTCRPCSPADSQSTPCSRPSPPVPPCPSRSSIGTPLSGPRGPVSTAPTRPRLQPRLAQPKSQRSILTARSSRRARATRSPGARTTGGSGEATSRPGCSRRTQTGALVLISISLTRRSFAIVLLTNQGTLSEELAHTNPAGYKGSKAQWFKDKVADIGAALDVPFHIFAATDMKDAFRKPQTGMWDAYVRDFNDGVVVSRSPPRRCRGLITRADMEESFFVGDAAGRPALRNRPKDHSNSDLSPFLPRPSRAHLAQRWQRTQPSLSSRPRSTLCVDSLARSPALCICYACMLFFAPFRSK